MPAVTEAVSLFMPKTDSLRMTSPLAHAGHATTVADAVWTYRSKSRWHARQRYS